MHLPEGSKCIWCNRSFKIGDAVYVTWSDFLNKQAVFHASCWNSEAKYIVDFLPALNKREKPS